MTAGKDNLSLLPDRASDRSTEIEDRCDELHQELKDQGLLGNDLGLSYLFALLHGDQLRYCAAEGCWYVWQRQRWSRDRTQEAASRLQRMLAEMMALDPDACRSRARKEREDRDDTRRYQRIDMAEEGAASDSPRSVLARWAWQVRGGAHRTILALAQADPDLAVLPEDFDDRKDLFGVANGVLELSKSGVRFRSATQDDMLTMSSPVAYSPRAKCPKFDRFVAEIMAEDAELIAWVQRALGSCLCGLAARDQVLLVLQGDGANGKSTLMSLIAHVLGDYAQQADPKLITIQRGDRGVPLDLHRVRKARLVNIVEPSQTVDLDEGRIKQITGGEPIVHRMHHQAEQTSTPAYKLVLQTNPLPRVTGSDKGIWRRLQLVPFRRTFEGAARNSKLLAELKEEAPGVLRWLVEGFQAWTEQGLGTCPAVWDASTEARSETDSIGTFLAELCRPDPEGASPARSLYSVYARWCRAAGHPAKSETAFGRALTAAGYSVRQTAAGRLRVGLVLVLDDEDESPEEQV